jgi:hypothetical protein
MPSALKREVLWIRNIVRSWILLFRSFRFRILPGQLNNWQILSISNGTVARLFKPFKIYQGALYVINDELDHFAENFGKIIRVFLFNPETDLTCPKNSGSGSTPAKGSVFLGHIF